MSNHGLVYVVVDDESLRCSLQSLFQSVGFDVRGFGSAAEFLASDLGDANACLVLDVRLPSMNGLEFQRKLNELGIRLPVIFISGFADVPMSVQGMKAGAVDFFTKPFRDQDILDAVAAALASDRERRARWGVFKLLQDRFYTLSARERQVMALVVAGLLNKQVAVELVISEVTVKIHRGNVMRKMGARTLAELVHMSEQLGEGAR